MSNINTHGTDCTDTEWVEYCNMPQIRDNETPSEWMIRIWECLMYFRENNLFNSESKKYLEGRKLITYWSKVNGFYKSYVPEIGMERHWATHCTENTFCGVSYDEYLLKIKQKSTSGYIYDNEYALHRYKLWKSISLLFIDAFFIYTGFKLETWS
ncbi:hypothetical protein C2G38_2178153 [Gigaspora rosea]|uniref:Uncharacterized protein n=1 Tax=Gigaspora rosea TaxID=44941 RepID=A0A397VEH3_9GLOM|nr:hypothetical protein C2G38_2178153 [Gigaspora rosea]